MADFNFTYAAQGPVLDAFQNCWDRIVVIRGPLGSAKTIQCCTKIFTAINNQEPNARGTRHSRWYAIRNTYPDLTTTTVKDWMSLFGDLGRYVGGGLEPPTHRLRYDLPDGTNVKAEIVFLALDQVDAIRKVRGSQMTGVWLNEMKELRKDVVDILDLRHGRYPSIAMNGAKPNWHGMIGDTNAPDEDHWLYRLAEEDRPKGWSFFTQPGGLLKEGDKWVENPEAENLRNLPDGYYINGMEGKDEDWISVYLGNNYGFVREGKPVHPQYVDSIHCSQEILQPMPKITIYLGCDFGRTPAAAFAQKLPNGRWQCFDEFTSEDVSAVTFAPELKRYIDQEYKDFKFSCWGDPSGDSKGQATDDTPFKIMRAAGIAIYPTDTNNPLVRRAALANPMLRNCMDGKPAFVISPKCVKIRKGLAGGFHYKRLRISGERYSPEPDKNEYSDPVEALEYAHQGAGEGRDAMRGKSNFTKPVVINTYNPMKRRRA